MKLVTGHRVQKLLRLMAAASVVIPLGLPRAHSIQQPWMWALLPWRYRDFLLRETPLGDLPHRRSLITTDALLTGWGAIWKGRTVRALWSSKHLNVLELRAIHLGSLLPFIHHKHMLVRTDSTSAVYHTNHQGGCLQVARLLLTWVWPWLASLKAIHIPSIANRAADILSKTRPLLGEWQLYPDIVTQITRRVRHSGMW